MGSTYGMTDVLVSIGISFVRLLDVRHGAVSMILQEVLDTQIAVLIEVSVVNAAGGHDQDFQRLALGGSGGDQGVDAA